MVLYLRLGCKLINILNILLSQILIGYLSNATHFRGAQFWWEPDPNNASQIHLTFRIAWRRDYSEKTVCDRSTITSGVLIGPVDAGYIMCVTNCAFRVGNMDFRCTDYSIQEGWTSGLRTHVVTFPKPGYYQISWRGRSWLEEVIRGANADWEFLITVNTTPRAETGVMNSSPRSAVGTILRIQEGCNQTLSIPVSDPNGDIVRCRWAVDKECGGICNPPEGFVLYQQSCKIEFHSSAVKGKYAIALQIEDFEQSATDLTRPLSSVPLQFIVEIYPTYNGNVTVTPTKEQCNLAPMFLDPTPKNGQCFPINVGSTYVQRIITRTKDKNTSIREINTVSNIGMTKSGIDRYNGELTDYYVNITWAPVQSQVGDSIFCFTAVDSAGISSEQRCIYISISSSSPMATRATYQIQQQTIQVHFNQSIQMPTTSQTLNVYDSKDQKILSVTTNNSEVVSYTNTTLIVQVPNQANLNGQYYILLPTGAVRGNQRCGPQSIAVTDKSTLSFNTGTPPSTEPSSQPSTEKNDYMWLIILVVIVVVLFIFLIILAIVIRWRLNTAKSGAYARKERQEEYLRNLQYQTKIVGYDGPYAPNFHDIEVKFR